jgi:hypothetical protein
MSNQFEPGSGWREVDYEEFEELGMQGVVVYGPTGTRHWVEDGSSDAPCDAEIHSWQVFTPDQTDSYWMRCDLVGPHTRHENSETGAHWT